MEAIQDQWFPGAWEGGTDRWSTENFQVSEIILYNTLMVDTCSLLHLSKSIECTKLRVNPNIICER